MSARRRRGRLLRWTLIGLLAALSFVAPRAAQAGIYRVYACSSAIDPRAENWYGTGGSAGTAPYAICPASPNQPYSTGLGARTTGGSGSHVAPGGGSWAQFDAPPGTTLAAITFSGSLGGQGHDVYVGCWETGLSAWADGAAPQLVWGLPPCYQTGGGWQDNVSMNLGGTRHMRVGVRCAGAASCQADWNGGHGVWANLRDIGVYLDDHLAPSVTPNAGSLLEPGWHRGTGQAGAAFYDNAGIRRITLSVDGATVQSQDFLDAGWEALGVRCDYAYAIPCKNIPTGRLEADTRRFTDGPHTLRLTGEDPGANATNADRALLVDNNAPDAPRSAEVVGGDGWRRSNVFDVAWRNPDQGPASPIVQARYSLCRVGAPSDCRAGSQAGRGIASLRGVTVPGEGTWTLRVWLVDEAGNADPARASDPVTLRFDPQVDAAAFAPLDRGDPRKLEVLVADRTSGIAGGGIEIRRRGSAAWRALPTALAGDRLVAQVPDTELADGAYDLRATARDVAGNERLADRFGDGSPAVAILPLREVTRLSGEVRGAGTTRRCRTVRTVRRRVVRRRRVCRTVSDGGARLGDAITVPFGRGMTVRGLLRGNGGRPLAGAPVEVAAEPRTGGGYARAATLRTDSDGAFSYAVPAGPSRTILFACAGDPLLKPASAGLLVRVPAAATLRPSRRSLFNGRTVLFSGRLVGRPLPGPGKLVVLQAFYRRAWRTFAVTRADAGGRFRQGYRFQATRGRVAYRFRAVVPREPSYAYETGTSRTVTIVVRG